jgi:hypothetical protein
VKRLILSLALLAPCAAFADTKTEIHCVTKTRIEDRTKAMSELTLTVANLESGKLEIEGDEENPIIQKPKDSVMDINDNLEYSRTKDGNLRILSDGDGETETEVQIYKDSGFKSGFVSVKFTEDKKKNAFSKLTCTVK